jgi:DNA-binding MarR family transcriptional regulator
MALGQWSWTKKPGYGLVEAVDDPQDTRRKIMFLTEAGREFAAKVVRVISKADAGVFVSPTADDHREEVYRTLRARINGARSRTRTGTPEGREF